MLADGDPPAGLPDGVRCGDTGGDTPRSRHDPGTTREPAPVHPRPGPNRRRGTGHRILAGPAPPRRTWSGPRGRVLHLL